LGFILVVRNKAIVVNKWIIVVDALIDQTCPLYEIEDEFILHSFLGMGTYLRHLSVCTTNLNYLVYGPNNKRQAPPLHWKQFVSRAKLPRRL
jgi:hypothetical protein